MGHASVRRGRSHMRDADRNRMLGWQLTCASRSISLRTVKVPVFYLFVLGMENIFHKKKLKKDNCKMMNPLNVDVTKV